MGELVNFGFWILDFGWRVGELEELGSFPVSGWECHPETLALDGFWSRSLQSRFPVSGWEPE